MLRNVSGKKLKITAMDKNFVIVNLDFLNVLHFLHDYKNKHGVHCFAKDVTGFVSNVRL